MVDSEIQRIQYAFEWPHQLGKPWIPPSACSLRVLPDWDSVCDDLVGELCGYQAWYHIGVLFGMASLWSMCHLGHVHLDTVLVSLLWEQGNWGLLNNVHPSIQLSSVLRVHLRGRDVIRS